jgi:hypothetical protein
MSCRAEVLQRRRGAAGPQRKIALRRLHLDGTLPIASVDADPWNRKPVGGFRACWQGQCVLISSCPRSPFYVHFVKTIRVGEKRDRSPEEILKSLATVLQITDALFFRKTPEVVMSPTVAAELHTGGLHLEDLLTAQKARAGRRPRWSEPVSRLISTFKSAHNEEHCSGQGVTDERREGVVVQGSETVIEGE